MKTKSAIIFGFFILVLITIFGVVRNPRYHKVTKYIDAEVDVPLETIDYIESCINTLPQPVKNEFKDGWKIRVCKKIGFNNKVIGRTIPKDKIIYIKLGYESQAVLHEFAHVYLTKIYNKDITKDEEFMNVFHKESQAMINAYYGDSEYDYNNPVEYFCSCWNIVFTLREDTQKAAPETFTYYTNLFNSLCK